MAMNWYLQHLHCCSPSLPQTVVFFTLWIWAETKHLCVIRKIASCLSCYHSTWGVMLGGWSSQSHKIIDKKHPWGFWTPGLADGGKCELRQSQPSTALCISFSTNSAPNSSPLFGPNLLFVHQYLFSCPPLTRYGSPGLSWVNWGWRRLCVGTALSVIKGSGRPWFV